MKKSITIIGGLLAVATFAAWASGAVFIAQASGAGVLTISHAGRTDRLFGMNPDCIYAGVRVGDFLEIRSLCWLTG